MDSYWLTLIIVCPMVFFGGFVDAIAGGGGLITLPAYIFAGLPIHIAYGNNKFANCIGTFVASIKFFKGGHIKIKSSLVAALGALLGSWFGTQLVLILSEKTLNYCLMIILPVVGIFMLANRNFGKSTEEKQMSVLKKSLIYFVIGLVVGAYDGFFGPGTGTFLIIGFTLFIGVNVVTASGNAKIVNLASNLAALITYIINGKVVFAIGIPAAICSVLGNYLGAQMAIKGGAKIIRPIIIVVMILLIIKVLSGLV